MTKYVILTGIRRFEQEAEYAREAIALLKLRIRARSRQHKNPEIGMSLVQALAEGRLNFLVLDESGNSPLAGEYQGIHQSTPEPQLILLFKEQLPPDLVRRAKIALSENGKQ